MNEYQYLMKSRVHCEGYGSLKDCLITLTLLDTPNGVKSFEASCLLKCIAHNHFDVNRD